MHLPPVAHPVAAAPAATAQARKLRTAAQQFEGMLISTLWSGFQNDPMTAPDDSDPGADSIRSLGLQAMSTALSASGGLGLAAMIEKQLTPRASQPAVAPAVLTELKSQRPAADTSLVARPPLAAPRGGQP